VSHASGYTIQYATNSGFTSGLGTVTVLGGTVTTADLTGLTTNTPYYIRVMANGTGEYSNSVYSAGTNNTPRVQPLTAPTGITATVKNSTTLTIGWNAVANASGYRIQYATDVYFTENVKTEDVNNGTATSGDITALTVGTTYYVRVMAIGEENYSNSIYSTLYVEGTPVVKLPAPTLGTITAINSTTINVAWSAVGGVTSYTLQYSTEASFNTGVITIADIALTSTSRNVDELNPNCDRWDNVQRRCW
jgi:hypothetical protein